MQPESITMPPSRSLPCSEPQKKKEFLCLPTKSKMWHRRHLWTRPPRETEMTLLLATEGPAFGSRPWRPEPLGSCGLNCLSQMGRGLCCLTEVASSTPGLHNACRTSSTEDQLASKTSCSMISSEMRHCILRDHVSLPMVVCRERISMTRTAQLEEDCCTVSQALLLRVAGF